MRTSVTWPKDDGLWLVNLETGQGRLSAPVASARDRMPPVKDPKGLAYFCHTVLSRDGSKIFWLARSVENMTGQKVVTRWATTAFTCNRDGSNVQRCFHDGWGGSHFNWLDGERLLVTAKYNDAVCSHVMFTVGKFGLHAAWRRTVGFRRPWRLLQRRPMDGDRHLPRPIEPGANCSSSACRIRRSCRWARTSCRSCTAGSTGAATCIRAGDPTAGCWHSIPCMMARTGLRDRHSRALEVTSARSRADYRERPR